MIILLTILVIYLITYMVVCFFNIVDEYSLGKTILIILFIPFVAIWEIIEPKLTHLLSDILKKRVKKDFDIDGDSYSIRQSKEAKFLLSGGYYRNLFVCMTYIIFGIKLKGHNKGVKK